MIHSIFSIYDQAVKSYNQPWFVQSKDLGKRLFIAQVNQDPKTPLYQNAEQFVLYYLGTYDDETCEFALITPEAVMRASDCKDPKVGEINTFDERLDSFEKALETLRKEMIANLNTIKGALQDD